MQVRKSQWPRWTWYPVGCLLALAVESDWWPEGGLSFDIKSDVPDSAGVSSSAALEIATLYGLAELAGFSIDSLRIAHLGRAAENLVAGAPCGLMDQLASACGEPGRLLPILCRPDLLRDPLPLPQGCMITGWMSGVRHSVGDSPYGTARAAAFMGKCIVEKRLGIRAEWTSELPLDAVSALPVRLSGKAFLSEYGGVEDPLSKIDPKRDYPVRAATLFPVEENRRAETACALLAGSSDSAARELGALLFESHAGYGAMGLGCPETDEMIARLKAIGPDGGAYGGRISGGGAGGTVVVLAREEAFQEIRQRLPAMGGWIR